MRRELSLAALLLVGLPGTAGAFCRTTTSSVPADYDPSVTGCWPEGLPVYWANACVSYDIQADASHQISYDVADQTIALAFSQWTRVECAASPDAGADGGGSGRVSIDVRDFGPVACSLVQYNEDAPNQHAIVFRDQKWPHAYDSSNTLALTTVTYDTETGEIYDADMEINTAEYTFSTSETVPPDGYDFQSIVTHETGHFLGMAHSTDTMATMYAHYTPGDEVMRHLTDDDIAGICSIYPPGLRHVAANPYYVDAGADVAGYYQADAMAMLPEEVCDPTPRHGWSSACATEPSSGCSVATGDASPPYECLVGLAFVLARRRRSRGRS